MLRNATLVLLAAASPALAAGAAGSAAGIPISGRVYTDVYAPARDADASTYRQVSASAWLQGDPRLGDSGSAHFVLQADQFETSLEYGSQFRATLREAYVEYSKGSFDLRFGRQIIPWGKSDVINPTGFLTATDYAYFNPDNEVRRIGATTLSATWTPREGMSPWSLTAVLQPLSPESVPLIAPSVIPANVALAPAPISPSASLGNTAAAAKLAYNGGSWDASLLAYRGFNAMPEFFLAGLGGTPLAPTASVAQTFHRITAAGGDASFTAGRYVLRAETAYVWTQNDDGANTLIQPSHWDTVLGVERPFGDDFRAQAQFLYRYIPHFVDPTTPLGTDSVSLADTQIAEANALLLGYQDQSRPGYTLRLAYSNEESGVDAEAFLMGNLVGGDFLLQPKFTYALTDALKGTLGLDWYAGPENRPLGALKEFSSFFAEAKYSF